MIYVTGTTALNIPLPHRITPGWHSLGLVNISAWRWAGVNMMPTEHLLGEQELYDATDALRVYAPDTPQGTLAATYERAVFDLLFHFTVQGKPVPGYQAKDIDDTVDFGKVRCWIEAADLPMHQKIAMLDWLSRI